GAPGIGLAWAMSARPPTPSAISSTIATAGHANPVARARLAALFLSRSFTHGLGKPRGGGHERLPPVRTGDVVPPRSGHSPSCDGAGPRAAGFPSRPPSAQRTTVSRSTRLEAPSRQRTQ